MKAKINYNFIYNFRFVDSGCFRWTVSFLKPSL